MTGKLEDKRINEALEILNEVAKEKKAALQDMISEKYGNLQSVLGGVAEHLQDQAFASYEQGKKKVKELASEVEDGMRKNPWPYVAGTALGFLIFGYFLGSSKK